MDAPKPIATVDVRRLPWPMSAIDGWRKVRLYGRSRIAIEDAVRGYARSLGEEASLFSERSPVWGRLYFYGGHVLGWAGLALAVAGLFAPTRPDHYELVFGAFGVGILMILIGAPLTRHGRELLTPSAAEVRAVDKRRPVLLLASFRNSDTEIVADAEAQGAAHTNAVEDTIGLAFRRFGPFEALRGNVLQGARTGTFGEANWESIDARAMDGAAFLIACPAAGDIAPGEFSAIARRRHAHKLLVLMPPLDGQWPWDGTIEDANDEELRRRRDRIEEALDWTPKTSAGGVWDRTKRRVRSLAESEEALRIHRWTTLRSALKDVPGFATLPEAAPRNVLAVHLDSAGELVIVTGPKIPSGHDYMRAITTAIYGMKCHGRA